MLFITAFHAYVHSQLTDVNKTSLYYQRSYWKRWMQVNVKWTNGKGLGISIFNDVNLISRFVNNLKKKTNEKNLVTKKLLFQNVCYTYAITYALVAFSCCIFYTKVVYTFCFFNFRCISVEHSTWPVCNILFILLYSWVWCNQVYKLFCFVNIKNKIHFFVSNVSLCIFTWSRRCSLICVQCCHISTTKKPNFFWLLIDCVQIDRLSIAIM